MKWPWLFFPSSPFRVLFTMSTQFLRWLCLSLFWIQSPRAIFSVFFSTHYGRNIPNSHVTTPPPPTELISTDLPPLLSHLWLINTCQVCFLSHKKQKNKKKKTYINLHCWWSCRGEGGDSEGPKTQNWFLISTNNFQIRTMEWFVLNSK